MTDRSMRPKLFEILNQAKRNNGNIEVDVWISLSEVVDVSEIDGFNDLLEEHIVFGEVCLTDIGYKIIGHTEDSIQFLVTASIEADNEDEKEE